MKSILWLLTGVVVGASIVRFDDGPSWLRPQRVPQADHRSQTIDDQSERESAGRGPVDHPPISMPDTLGAFGPREALTTPAVSINELPPQEEPQDGKPVLRFGSPNVPAPRGDTFWMRIYQKFGDQTPNEYERIATMQHKLMYDLCSVTANEKVAAGEFYPWSDSAALATDDELRRRVGGENPELWIGGSKEPIGRYYVIFERDRYPEIYEAYWDYYWLSSAADGSPLHRDLER